jgi:hypothetical protein
MKYDFLDNVVVVGLALFQLVVAVGVVAGLQ